MSEPVRVSFSLVSLMQLNLVRRRLETLAAGDAFVHPEDLKPLLQIMEEWLPDREELHALQRSLARKDH